MTFTCPVLNAGDAEVGGARQSGEQRPGSARAMPRFAMAPSDAPDEPLILEATTPDGGVLTPNLTNSGFVRYIQTRRSTVSVLARDRSEEAQAEI